jgi:predicted nucleotidyltransferase
MILVLKVLMDNLPASLREQREVLAKCLAAMDRALPLKAVYLFGSHARGEARAGSDVDLCLVAEGAGQQLKAARQFRRAMREIRPKPPFTLVPIAPQRLAQKQAVGDHFFHTILKEGVLLAATD